MLSKFLRISSIPGRTLLWLFLKKDLKNLKGQLGVDLAGGSMLNKRFFKTKKYFSVDINQIKLAEGLKTFPDAVAVNDTIQNFLSTTHEKPDLFICVQTLGTNMFFDSKETIQIIKNMTKVLKKDGSMAFNVGIFGNIDLNELQKDLSSFLNSNFKNVDFKFYGAFHKRSNSQPRWKLTDEGMQLKL